MSEQAEQQGEHERASPGFQSPFWERAVAFLGLILVVGALGFLLYEGIWGNQSPPDVSVTPIEILESGENYLVRFKAHNRGGETAAGVQVTGALTRDGKQLEKTEVTVDYVPPNGTAQGGLYFSSDPRHGELKLSAAGYQRP